MFDPYIIWTDFVNDHTDFLLKKISQVVIFWIPE